jgi:hypothetical protein
MTFTTTTDKCFGSLAIGERFYMPGGRNPLEYYKVSDTECATQPTNWAMRFKLTTYTAVWAID